MGNSSKSYQSMAKSIYVMKNLLLIGGALGLAYMAIRQSKGSSFILPTDNSYFPLKEGDKNIFVSNVQKALINKGGEPSRLILAGGGATGVYTSQTGKALELCGYPRNLSETHYRQLVNGKDQVRNIAYVIDVNGADLYNEVSNQYIPDFGYGRDRLIQLPAKTHLGKATGNYRNGMIELTTTINTSRKKFWVETSKVALVSSQEYEYLKKTSILPKSDEAKMKLLKN